MSALSAKIARTRVVDFYRALYGEAAPKSDLFHCRLNSVFAHPVLTPNFFLGSSLDEAALTAQATSFGKDFGLKSHWVQLFADQDQPRLLERHGYRKSLLCQFNFFDRPYKLRAQASVKVESVQRIADIDRVAYETGASRNSTNLPIPILRLVERVLIDSHGEVSYDLARAASGELLGAVTVVRAGHASLFVNGWVERSRRRQGVMSTLFNQATTRELAAGQRFAFFWTLNPFIEKTGDAIFPVQIYERTLSP